MVEKSLPTMTLHWLEYLWGMFYLVYIVYAEASQTETETNVWECSADWLQSVASVSVNTAYSLHTLHQQYSLGIRY